MQSTQKLEQASPAPGGSAGPTLGFTIYRGAGRPVPLVAQYLADPPGDLPPGLVGVLTDERADMRDVVATVVDLARQGHLTIRELPEPDLTSSATRRDFEYTLKNPDATHRYETTLLARMFADAPVVRLSGLRVRLARHLPAINQEMYQALVERGLFDYNPDQARRAYNRARRLAGWGGGLALLVITIALPPLALCTVPLFLAGLVGLLVVARPRSHRSALGADQAGRWQAFGRYLQNLRLYTDVREAARRFDRHLPYAIALGVEKEYGRQFEQVAMDPFDWYIPYSGGWSGDSASAGYDDAGAFNPSFGVPDIEALNSGMVGMVESLNDSITGMIDSTVAEFGGDSGDSSGGSDGGGDSGGGDSGGGGDGGGGGGD